MNGMRTRALGQDLLHRIIEILNGIIHNVACYCMQITVTTEIEIDHLHRNHRLAKSE